MYTTICKYTIVPGSGAELKRRIQAEFEPLISCLPGLVGYYLLEVSADQVISISTFDSKGHADLASGPMGFWRRNILGDSILGWHETILGQTEVDSRMEARSSRSVRQQQPPADGHGALDRDHLRVSRTGRTSGTAIGYGG